MFSEKQVESSDAFFSSDVIWIRARARIPNICLHDFESNFEKKKQTQYNLIVRKLQNIVL
jgi:hypothetical protein